MIVLMAIASLLPAAAVHAQRADSLCDYASCALSIVPRLAGLDVVRGGREARVASLPFLWPRDVTAPFAADPSAKVFARSASKRRRIAAAVTDVGAAIAAFGVARITRDGGRLRGASGVTLVGGIALLGISVPLQFGADAELSRAVWRYNQRFSR